MDLRVADQLWERRAEAPGLLDPGGIRSATDPAVQTRHADRDHAQSDALERHREAATSESLRREAAIEKLADEVRTLLEINTRLTREIHDRLDR